MSAAPISPSLHTAGVAIVSVAGFISLLAILALTSYIAYQAWRHKVGPKSPVGLLKSQFGALYACLIVADTMQAIAFISSLARLQPKPLDHVPASCTAQAVLLNAGDVGSACFNISIALHTCYVVLRKKKPPSWSVALAIVIVCCMMLLFTLLGPFTIATSAGGAFYNDTGFWCWIDKAYQPARLYLHYVWVFLAAGVSIGSYCCVFAALYFRKKFQSGKQQAAARKLDELAKRMLFFPIIYLINILPIAIARCLAMAGHVVPYGYLLFAGTIFALNGAFNVILFGRTHHLISFKKKKRQSIVMGESQLTLPVTTTRRSSSRRKNSLDDMDLDAALEKGPDGEEQVVPVLLEEASSPVVELDEEGRSV